MKRVEIDENRGQFDEIIEDVCSGREFGKQNPLSTLDVFCGAMI